LLTVRSAAITNQTNSGFGAVGHKSNNKNQ